jgi:hypothetical protein
MLMPSAVFIGLLTAKAPADSRFASGEDGPDRLAWRNTDWRWQDDAVVVTEEGRRQAVCQDGSRAER